MLRWAPQGGQLRASARRLDAYPILCVQLTARVTQLTAHLKEHRKDYSTTRGLIKLLSRRKSLMEYLKKHNRWSPLPAAAQGLDWQLAEGRMPPHCP